MLAPACTVTPVQLRVIVVAPAAVAVKPVTAGGIVVACAGTETGPGTCAEL